MTGAPRARCAAYRRLRGLSLSLFELPQQRLEIERQRRHRDVSVLAWPGGGVAVGIELDAVCIWIAKIERLAHEVVGGADQGYAGITQAHEQLREVPSRRHTDRDVEEARAARWW